jgi:hypothetical protein
MFWLMFFLTIKVFIWAMFIVQFFYIVFGGYAPFFLTKNKVIKRIMDEEKFNDSDAIYELGSGNAGFLRAVENKYPNIKKLIGIEYFLAPYIIGRIQTGLLKSKIKIIKENFFHTNLKEADVIYCFLNKQMMNKLKEKFTKECKSGTKIISYQFSIPEMNPEKVIDLNNDKKDKVYFYKI